MDMIIYLNTFYVIKFELNSYFKLMVFNIYNMKCQHRYDQVIWHTHVNNVDSERNKLLRKSTFLTRCR